MHVVNLTCLSLVSRAKSAIRQMLGWCSAGPVTATSRLPLCIDLDAMHRDDLGTIYDLAILSMV